MMLSLLCLNTGSVAKLVVVGSEFQTLTTLSAKNWLRIHHYYSVTAITFTIMIMPVVLPRVSVAACRASDRACSWTTA